MERNNSKVARLIGVSKFAHVLLDVGELRVIAEQSVDLLGVKGSSGNWMQEQDCKAMEYLPSIISINQPVGS